MTIPSYNWRLRWDDHPTISCHVPQRPSLVLIPRIEEDGSLVPGGHYWNLLHVDLASPVPLWQNETDVFLFVVNEEGCDVERWLLKNASHVNNGYEAALSFTGVTRVS